MLHTWPGGGGGAWSMIAGNMLCYAMIRHIRKHPDLSIYLELETPDVVPGSQQHLRFCYECAVS